MPKFAATPRPDTNSPVPRHADTAPIGPRLVSMRPGANILADCHPVLAPERHLPVVTSTVPTHFRYSTSWRSAPAVIPWRVVMRPNPKVLLAWLGGLCATGLLAATAIADEKVKNADAHAPGPEPGVWKKHDYSFQYMGFTSTYSCDGLADKLKLLLLLSGARADAKAEPGACAGSFGHPDRFARARLVFYTLAPSVKGGASKELGQGVWRPVAFAAHSPIDLLLGDCELVEQFSHDVLKKMFTIRNVVDKTTCIPHQESGSLIDLRFEAFVPVPAPADAVAPSPR
jgi:hypothetical protein